MTEPDIIDAELIEDDTRALVPIPAPTFTLGLRPGLSPEDTAVEDWLDEQRSPHTRRSYATAMRQWRAWLNRYDCCSLWLPHRRHAFAWRDSLLAAGRGAKTVDDRLVGIRSFYDFLCDLDGSPLVVNPLKSKKLLLNRGAHQRTQALSREEVGQLTTAAKGKVRTSRKGLVRGNDARLLVVFLATTGCRIDEARKLTVGDLGRQAGHPVATLTRKGGKRQEVAVDAHVFDMLARHVEGSPPDHHVFQPYRAAGRTGAGYSYSGAYSAVQSASMAAGLVTTGKDGKKRGRVHPHMLRSTVATQTIDAGSEITDVQDQLGHASTDTTRMYDRGGRRLRRMAGVAGVMAEMVDLEDEDG